MSLLIETIRLSDGVFNNLPYHEARMERAWTELFPQAQPLALAEMLTKLEFPKIGLYRCRVSYDSEWRGVEFIPYEIREVQTLKLVYDNAIAYKHKFKDRKNLERLFVQRGECDEVLIIRNGLVTDTSYANILFKKGNDWVTPSSCLLPGTMRQYLIDRKAVTVREIRADEIQSYESFKLINAMLLDKAREIHVNNIWQGLPNH